MVKPTDVRVIPNHFPLPKLTMPDPLGKQARDRLVQEINQFEARLAPDQELGGRFIATVSEGVVHIDDVRSRGDLIIFQARTSDGRPIQVVQHFTQVNITLAAVPVETGQEPRRIGFELAKRA